MDIVASRSGQGRLGTFAGVFTPSILTILGLILFLRLGFAVGQGGLSSALLVLALANTISVLTSLSLAAIATNLRIKRGGDYYLISRTLGHEYGGAIGIVLFLAQAVSVAFYCIGFGEVMAAVLGAVAGVQVVAAAAIAVLFVFAWLGADWATRFQYVIMAVLALALVSFFAGGFVKWDTALITTNWPPAESGLSFWILFGLIFPAVTGFTQGVSMSGELRDPGRSLPLGTFFAVGLSMLVYFAVAVLFAATTPRDALVAGVTAMQHVAVFDELIVAGALAATLSSAMASFLGAPRILQSLAADGIFPWLKAFARGSGPHRNPRRGILLTGVLALATVALGNLDLVAPIVSMFFLISYGLINYATHVEARSRSPSFRPRFRWFDHRLSLVGALACLGAMLAVDVVAGLVAVAIVFAVHQYLRRTAREAVWADGRRSFHLHEVRAHLKAASESSDHPRDWRPVILVFSDSTERRTPLLRFASWLEGDSGFTTAVKLVEGGDAAALVSRRIAEERLEKDIEKAGVGAYPLAIAAADPMHGVQQLIQGFGLGPLRANLILINWLEHRSDEGGPMRELLLGRQLRAAFRLGCNLTMLDADHEDWRRLDEIPPEERRIDVWWRDDATSHLALLLAYLMTRTETWDGAPIRVIGMKNGGQDDAAKLELEETLIEARIDADVEIARATDADEIARLSGDAALVFVPFRLLGDRPTSPFKAPLEKVLEHLPIAALVMAAKDIDLDAEPEDMEPKEGVEDEEDEDGEDGKTF